MVDSAFETMLRNRLCRREGDAEMAWRGALSSLGMSESAINETLQRIGQRLTWILWNIAIEEADGIG